MTQAGKAVIDQQEGTEGGSVRGWPGRSVLFADPLEECTYSPPASGRWYCLRQSYTLRGRSGVPSLPSMDRPADANGGLCVGQSFADALGTWGPWAINKHAPGIYGALLATTINAY